MDNIEAKGTTVKNAGETAQPSKVDLLSGQHTTSIIFAILFTIVFLGLITVIIVRDNGNDLIITGLFSLLSLLAGFFAGSQSKKSNDR